MAWISIGRLEDIAPLGARRFRRSDGLVIAVFRTAADTVFALRDKCPHKGGPLSQGIVFGESVACPLHNWCIGLADGKAAAPDEGVVERFAVKLENGQVLLDPESGTFESRTCSPATLSAVVPAQAGTRPKDREAMLDGAAGLDSRLRGNDEAGVGARLSGNGA